MKKILIPIDYSDYSNNAVDYAISIANKINADIHLCHALDVPDLNPMAGAMLWPLENFSELYRESDEELQTFVEKLKTTKPIVPNITFSTETGSVKFIINKLTKEIHFDLIIMGLAGAGKLNRFFLGSNSRDVIENCKVPVLLIPKETSYQPFKKVAFATDLSESDINSVHHLTRLLALFNPEILLVHVSEQPSDFHDPRTPANVFLNNVTCKLNYSKIYYRQIKANGVDEGLKWLSENAQIDMLAMIHRHSSIFSRMLEGSHTQKMATAVHLPLLVMPENKSSIGW
ncbi:MAG: universal stress protein [Bacteroidia bacterium]